MAAVAGEDLPPVELGVSAREELGHPGQDKVPQAEGVAGDKVGLADQASILSANLAHGDQRRLEIALALATKPEMMVLDEPAAGMSIEERASLVELLRSMVARDGVTVLFTEHDMDVVFRTAERITVMHEGRILTAGKPEEVKMNEEVQRVYFGEVEHA